MAQLVVPYSLSKHSLSSFQYYYPGREIEPIISDDVHPHPLLAFERQRLEKLVVEMIRQEDPYGRIVDIGGNAKRQHKLGVFCCCPLLDAVDYGRNSRYSGLDNYCDHKFQDCDCVDPATYMCVHSLYYLSPDDVLYALNRCTNHVLYSVHHCFDNVYGSIARGEASYVVNSPHQVVMNTQGNSFSYKHNPLTWLRPGFYSNGIHACSWTTIHTGPHSVVVKFVKCRLDAVPVPILPISFSSALTDANYYGDVTFSGASFSGANRDTVKTLFTNIAVPITRLYSFGPSLIADTKVSETFVAPKTFIHELTTRIVGKPRDSVTYSNLMHTARDMIKSYDVPPEMIPRTLILATYLAFYATLHLEVETMQTMIDDHSNNFDRLNSLITKFTRLPVYSFERVYQAILVISCFLYLKNFRNLTAQHGVYGAVAIVFGVYFCYSRLQLGASIVDALFNRHQNGQNPINFLTQSVSNVNLSSFSVNPRNLIKYCWTKLKGLVIDEDIIVESPEYRVDDVKQGADRECLSLAGIVDPYVAPIVHSSTMHNEVVAVVNRGLKVSNFVDVDILDQFCDEMVSITHSYLPPKILSASYKYWNSRYPITQQQRHNKVYNVILDSSTPDELDFKIKAFVKREKLLHASIEISEKDPRLIQGRTDSFNVATGPVCLSISNYMIQQLHFGNNICYASGATCDSIGFWFSQIGHNNTRYTYYESDGKRYDSKQIVDVCAARVAVYATYTDQHHAIDAFTKDIHVRRGRTPHGVRYKVPGTMPSGSQDTSMGNSILNISTNVFNIKESTNITVKKVVNDIFMIVLGDDNITVVPSYYPKLTNKYLNALGLDIEMIERKNSYDLTFCSSYIYPVEGGFCLGPKVGRFLAKFGWYIDATKRDLFSIHLATIQSIERDVSFIEPLHMVVQKQKQLLLLNNVRPKKIPKSFNLHVGNLPKANEETAHFLNYHYGWDTNMKIQLQKELDSITQLPAFLPSTILERFLTRDNDVENYVGPISGNLVDILRGYLAEVNFTYDTAELFLNIISAGCRSKTVTQLSDTLLLLIATRRCIKRGVDVSLLRFIVGPVIVEELLKRVHVSLAIAFPLFELLVYVFAMIGRCTDNIPALFTKGTTENRLFVWFVLRRVIVVFGHYAYTRQPILNAILAHSILNLSVSDRP